MYKFGRFTKRKHKGFWGSVIGGIGGSLLSGLFNSSEAEANRKAQFDSLKYSMTHKYQDAMQDLKDADLNPIIAAGGLSGGGSSISGSAAQMPSPGNVISSAKQNDKIQAEIDAVNQSIAESKARTEKTESENYAARADAEIATIEALRRKNEYMNVDLNENNSRKFLGVTNSLPNNVKGPVRTLTTYYNDIIQPKFDSMLRMFKGGAANSAKSTWDGKGLPPFKTYKMPKQEQPQKVKAKIRYSPY